MVDDEEGSIGAGSIAGAPLRVLGNLLDSIVIQLDPLIYPGEDGLIEWHKHSSPALTDGMEIHRVGDRDCLCKISLSFDYSPTRYTLSPSLSRIVNLRQATHTQVLAALWSYIATRSLFNPQDNTQILPDAQLTVMLGNSSPVTLQQLNHHITQNHLFTAEPIHLSYQITMTPIAAPVAVYDITLPCNELPALNSITAALSHDLPYNSSFNKETFLPPSIQKEIHTIETQIHEQIKEFHRIKRRRDLLHTFAEQPLETIQLLLTQQTRLTMMTLTTQRAQLAEEEIRRQQQQMRQNIEGQGKGQGNDNSTDSSLSSSLSLGPGTSVARVPGEEEKSRRANYYSADWIADAVDRYLEMKEKRCEYGI